MSDQIIGLHHWFDSPPGRYLLAWEQARFDEAVANIFGYHSLQLGMPLLDGLRANRMPHQWLAMGQEAVQGSIAFVETGGVDGPLQRRAVDLLTEPVALPFQAASLDLLVLPHTLELSHDPHAALREVQRVLVHEGRVAIAGFNPLSLWGFKQMRVHLLRHLGGRGRLFLPEAGEFLGHRRLRDWLRLLEFEVEAVHFGCWSPAVRSASALARFAWMDRLGERWWPVFGATYLVVAVKRTQGAKLVGQTWKTAPAVAGAPVSIAGRAGHTRAGAQKA